VVTEDDEERRAALMRAEELLQQLRPCLPNCETRRMPQAPDSRMLVLRIF
jgi:hypothetical protein